MTASVHTRRRDWILSPDPLHVLDGPGVGLRVGVLALQGDFREHRAVLERLAAHTREVRHPRDLEGLHGLVIPGGESTTMSRLVSAHGLEEPIRCFHAAGGAVYGTCAGLIMASRGAVEGAPPTLGLMDVVARRNAFGRQVRSFEADLDVVGLPGGPLRAVFIRAPWVERYGPGVEVLASCDGHVVAARDERVLVTAFHPELTHDTRLHEMFLRMMRRDEDAAALAPAAVPGADRARRMVPAACANS